MVIVTRKLYSEDVEYNRHLPGLLDKDNVGLAVVLASAGSGATLTLATTHLLFSPKRGEVRLAQTALLLAHLDAITWNSESPHHTHDFYDILCVRSLPFIHICKPRTCLNNLSPSVIMTARGYNTPLAWRLIISTLSTALVTYELLMLRQQRAARRTPPHRRLQPGSRLRAAPAAGAGLGGARARPPAAPRPRGHGHLPAGAQGPRQGPAGESLVQCKPR